MKVLIINTRDSIGGAAIAAFRLLKGLQSIGVDASMLVLSKASDDPKVIAPNSKTAKALTKVYTTINSLVLDVLYGKKWRKLFSTAITPHDISKKIDKINPDIVNLHWVADGFLKIEDLKKIRQPIVWSLHDMWAFTGGCHNDWDCGKYVAQCGACPALHSHKEKDMSAWIYKRKKKTYDKLNNMTIIAQSKWLGQCAARSSLLSNKRIEILPNGINTEIFKPINKITARKILNLPSDKKMVLFGAVKPQSDLLKGYHHLVSALNHIQEEAIHLLVFGTSQPQPHMKLKHSAYYLGRFSDEISLALIYAAADVVVVPSVQENLSNVIMESLACGTPVVAFHTGGNADLIEHEKNGYLAKCFDTRDLAFGIEWVISEETKWQELSMRARTSVVEKYSLDQVAYRYKELFLELIAEKTKVNA